MKSAMQLTVSADYVFSMRANSPSEATILFRPLPGYDPRSRTDSDEVGGTAGGVSVVKSEAGNHSGGFRRGTPRTLDLTRSTAGKNPQLTPEQSVVVTASWKSACARAPSEGTPHSCAHALCGLQLDVLCHHAGGAPGGVLPWSQQNQAALINAARAALAADDRTAKSNLVTDVSLCQITLSYILMKAIGHMSRKDATALGRGSKRVKPGPYGTLCVCFACYMRHDQRMVGLHHQKKKKKKKRSLVTTKMRPGARREHLFWQVYCCHVHQRSSNTIT
jgi:hypothetical protein